MAGNSTALVWIWLFGSLTLLFSSVRYLVRGTVFELPTFVITSITFFALIVVSTWGITMYVRREKARNVLFKPEYQESEDAVGAFTFQTSASPLTQRVNVSLRLVLETHVEFVVVRFEGVGILPKIELLDDWHYEHGRRPSNVIEPYCLLTVNNGQWYWHYQSPHHRFAKSRITVGIDYLAAGPFEGDLVFGMTAAHGQKEQRLPFKVLGVTDAGSK